MPRPLGFFIFLPAILWGPRHVWADDAPLAEKDVRAAVAKVLPLLEKGAAGHMAQRTCFACHNQGVPLLALVAARSRGFVVNEENVRKNLHFTARFLDKNRANYLQGKGQGGQVDTAGYALWTLELGGWQPDASTAAVAEYFLKYQADADHWRATAQRPPSEASPFTANFLALRALHTFGSEAQRDRMEQRVKKVQGWLMKTLAKDTEDRVFRLWALARVGAAEETAQATAELLKSQRSNGGWGQLDKMEPDAYATGSALTALHLAGNLATTDPVYQRGLRFLLSTQKDDGTWFVKSRSKPFQLYYESGFPHGPDQFISMAASSWASTALTLACATGQEW